MLAVCDAGPPSWSGSGACWLGLRLGPLKVSLSCFGMAGGMSRGAQGEEEGNSVHPRAHERSLQQRRAQTWQVQPLHRSWSKLHAQPTSTMSTTSSRGWSTCPVKENIASTSPDSLSSIISSSLSGRKWSSAPAAAPTTIRSCHAQNCRERCARPAHHDCCMTHACGIVYKYSVQADRFKGVTC